MNKNSRNPLSGSKGMNDEQAFRTLMMESDIPTINAPKQLANSVRSTLPGSTTAESICRESERHSGRLKWILSSAALVLLFVVSVAFRPTQENSWAEVVKSLQSVPWIRLSGQRENDKMETWVSLPREVLASRNAELVRFESFRTGVRHEFHAKDSLIYQAPINDQRDFSSVSTIFQSIFRQDDNVGDDFIGSRIAKQARTSVQESGEKWIDYELTLQAAVGGPSEVVVVLRVDPETNLPVAMRLREGDDEWRMEVDYPEAGPQDIYALDVPRDTRVVDRMPSADLKQIAEILDRHRDELDNYIAAYGPTPGSPQYMIYRRGDQWRADSCYPVRDHFSSNQEYTAFLGEQPPADEEELQAWWKNRLSHYKTTPGMLCDGQTVYRASYDNPDSPILEPFQAVRPGDGHRIAPTMGHGGNMLEHHVYPDLNSYVQIELTLKRGPTDGPEGALRVTRSFPGQNQTSKYWLDPKLGYAAVKVQHSFGRAVENESDVVPASRSETYVYEDFEQSPRGIWYPTVVIRKNVIGPHETEAELAAGKTPAYSDLRTYYHLDFTSELPDALFKK